MLLSVENPNLGIDELNSINYQAHFVHGWRVLFSKLLLLFQM